MICCLFAIVNGMGTEPNDRHTGDAVRDEGREAKGTSQSQIVSRLMQRGVTASQIRRLRKAYQESQKHGGKMQDSDMTTGNLGMDDRMRYNNGNNNQRRYHANDDFMNGMNQYSQGRIIDYNYQHTYDANDPEYMEMQEAMDEWMPQDTASLVKALKKNWPVIAIPRRCSDATSSTKSISLSSPK